MKIYVASSWRNQVQPGLVARLREKGHDVYDFKNPNGAGPNTGFGWQQIDPNWRTWTREQYRTALTHAIAQKGFESDERGMIRADACVLCMPAGRSAHVEWGWMVGRGQLGYVLLSEDGFDPDLMYLLTPLTRICVNEEELFARIAEDDARMRNDELRPEYDLKTLRPTGRPIGQPGTYRSSAQNPNFSNIAKVADEIVLPGGVCNLEPPGDPLLLYIGGRDGVPGLNAYAIRNDKLFASVSHAEQMDPTLRRRGYVPIGPTLRAKLHCLERFAPEVEVYIHEERGLGKAAKDEADAYFERIKHLLP